MQEMTITSVHALGPRYAVILKEKDADRYLPILSRDLDGDDVASRAERDFPRPRRFLHRA